MRSTDVAALVGLARIEPPLGAPATRSPGSGTLPRSPLSRTRWRCSATCWRPAAISPAASRQFETVRFIERLGEIAGAVYDRALLRFELDHGASDDGRPAAQGAGIAAGATRHVRARHGRLGAVSTRPVRQAAAEIDGRRGYGADDARLQYHDGAIALARGDRAPADELLKSALALGPALDPIERAEAQRLLGVARSGRPTAGA